MENSSFYSPHDGGRGTQAAVDQRDYQYMVQNSDAYSAGFQFNTTFSGSANFVIIDKSDTVNFHHAVNDHLHIQSMLIDIDPSANAAYDLDFGFVKNVNGTNGDYYSIFHLGGSKKAGTAKSIFWTPHPSGPQLTDTFFATGNITLDDTAFQTDVALRSTLNPAAATVFPSDGDFILRVVLSAGDINLSMSGVYHSQSIS